MIKKIFITGGSASGKTFLANKLKETLGYKAIIISQDSFYKSTNSPDANFDLPSALDMSLQKEIMKNIKEGDDIEIPTYDFEKHDVSGKEKITIPEVVIFEGLFVLYDEELKSCADLTVFVDTPADTRFARRIKRDTKERGRDLNSIIERWITDVQPSYLKYIEPSRNTSDVIIPWSSINSRSVKLVLASIADIHSDK